MRQLIDFLFTLVATPKNKMFDARITPDYEDGELNEQRIPLLIFL